MSLFRISATNFRVVLRNRRDHAIKKATELEAKAKKFGEPRKDERGVIVVTEGTHLLRTARRWLQDSFDCEVLLRGTDDSDKEFELSRDTSRWLYKHLAPEDVQPDIGEFPAV